MKHMALGNITGISKGNYIVLHLLAPKSENVFVCAASVKK